MTTAYGMIGTGDFPSGHVPQSYREGLIGWDYKGMAPFTAITGKIETKPINSDKHTWFVQAPPERAGTVTGVYNDPALTSAYVANAGVAGTIVYVKMAAALAGEFLASHTVELGVATFPMYLIHGKVIAHPYVDGANSFVTVRLKESDVTVQAKTLANCNKVTIIGSAFAHGEVAPRSVVYYPEDLYNRTQIWRNALNLTNNALQEKTRYGTPEYKRVKGQVLQMHTLDREWSCIRGQRWEGIGANGQPEYHTMGMVDYIRRSITAGMIPSTHIADFRVDHAGKTWIEKGSAWLNTKMELLYRKGTNGERLSFCGSGVRQGINDIAMTYGTIDLTPESHVWGLDIDAWKHGFGKAGLITHPLFNKDDDWRNAWLFFNLRNIKWCPFGNMDLHFRKAPPKENEEQVAGEDGILEEFYTQGCYEWGAAVDYLLLFGVGKDG